MGDTYVSGGLDWIDAGFQNLTRMCASGALPAPPPDPTALCSDASVNLFSGTLPAAWGNLTRLAYMYVPLNGILIVLAEPLSRSQ